ncbi:MAG: hypothetical protein WC848_02385 [Parcubacteria group bacterium]|jgi:hypothetical protein
MQKIKTILKKVFPAVGVSLTLLFLWAQDAFAVWDPTSLVGTGLPSAPIYYIIVGILDWLLTIVGVIGVIGFVIAGLMYLTSAGQEDQIKTAKKAMLASIVGVLVAICGVVVMYAVNSMLNAESLF